MNKNVKITIAVAFVLTLLIGMGAGFLMRGDIKIDASGEEALRLEGRQNTRSAAIQQNEGTFRRDRQAYRNDEFRQRRDDRLRQNKEEEYPRRTRDFSRMKNHLQRELNLSDETLEELFSVLDEHRETVRENVIENQKRMRESMGQLREQLSEKLSEILTEEQMQKWEKSFAPRMERLRRAPRRAEE